MMHRLFKSHNLMNIFFAVLMSIPLISIGVRCAYVVVNKNAYQSYYGDTINEKEYTPINNKNDLVVGDTYNLIVANGPYTTNGTGNNQRIYFDVVNVYTQPSNYNLFLAKSVGIYVGNQTTLYYYFFDENNILMNDTPIASTTGSFNIDIQYISNNINSTILQDINTIFSIEYNTYSYLDNVFEYSVNQFISSNEIGNLNFFTWFNGVFFTNNAQASTYINFINWYLNYMILVSCGYILFLMLMWFVNFVRKLLDRSMNIYDK